jgi:hypothetical protein
MDLWGLVLAMRKLEKNTQDAAHNDPVFYARQLLAANQISLGSPMIQDL